MEAGSTGTAGRPDTRERAARTLAQTFCLVVGVVLVLVGVLGFIFGSSAFVAGTDVQGDEFIIFEVNGWHNIVHLATGAFLLLMAGTARTAVLGALIFGVVYIVVAIWGFVDGNDVISLVPINEPDNWLHLILGLLGLAVGFSAGGLAATSNGGGTTAERTPSAHGIRDIAGLRRSPPRSPHRRSHRSPGGWTRAEDGLPPATRRPQARVAPTS
jgi:hypothetical protein